MSTPLKQISSAARRATSLTRQLLTFSRKQVIQTRVINLNDVIKELANMLPRLIGEDITLQTEYGPELPAIRADTGMIEQILMNLAVNARDAMPKGGQLVVSTQALDINSNYSRQRPEARPGRFVCLTVRDTGCGMDAKTLARVFEPFFSTKEVGKGTGLGLATVYGIVKQHQGWVEVSSEVNVGTIFRIFFPASICEADKQSESGEATEFVHGGRETILLVEDEAPLREMVTRVLRGYNYRVLEATNGPEALKIWNEHSEDIDLLLTDMVMPGGLTGSDLARIVRERKPNLKVIFSSGFSAETVAPDFNEHSEFLAKPYRPNVLAQRVRKCLDAPARLNGVLAHA
jgi:CheY-like chemotaxis protein